MIARHFDGIKKDFKVRIKEKERKKAFESKFAPPFLSAARENFVFHSLTTVWMRPSVYY